MYAHGMPPDQDTCDLLCLDLPKAERVRASLPDVDELTRAAAAAKALGDPTRLAIALALHEEAVCVCDLAWIVGRDERLVSHHARLLKAADVARSRREGKMVIYELTEHGRSLVGAVTAERVAP
jgi:DNA-binding transcriptional ArsR family regulator